MSETSLGPGTVSYVEDEPMTLSSVRAELASLLDSRRFLAFNPAQQARYDLLCLHEQILLATAPPADAEEPQPPGTGSNGAGHSRANVNRAAPNIGDGLMDPWLARGIVAAMLIAAVVFLLVR